MRDKVHDMCRAFLGGQWDHISSDEIVIKILRYVFYMKLYSLLRLLNIALHCNNYNILHNLFWYYFSGGYSNQLDYCSLPDKVQSLNGEPRDVVIRFYGQPNNDGDDYKVTNSLITMLLSERRLGPKLYGVFAGGRLEEYIPVSRLLFQ